MSCSPLKKTGSVEQRVVNNREGKTDVQQQVYTDSSKTILKKDVRQNELQKITYAEEKNDEEYILLIREYDTAKPVEEKTGKPPLIRESIRTKRKTNRQKQEQIDKSEKKLEQHSFQQAQAEQIAKVVLQQQGRQQDESSIRADSRIKRGLNVLQKGLCGLGVILLLGLLVKGGSRYRKR